VLLFLPAIFVFLGGAGSGLLLAKRIRSPLLAGVLALVTLATLQFALARVPFNGLLTEVAVCALAAGLGAPAFALAETIRARYSDRPGESAAESARRRGARLLVVAVPLLIVMFGPGLMMPVTERVRYASHVAWSADGVVAEKYLDASNHQIPTLVIRDSRLGNTGATRLQGVDPAFWAAASVNDTLRKDPGHTNATLNGAPRPIVRPRYKLFGLTPSAAPD
jgi:hypothetical protein